MSARDDLSAGPANEYRLDDRYRALSGTVFLTGIQALARLPIEQLRLDYANGRNTAAFISGYPGSPLAGMDQEIPRSIRAAGEGFPIHHLPAVNEELGVTAVMGSQLAATRPDCRYDGISGIWYGKAPGLDRATDALRHSVFTGSSATGGALAIVGDDPSAKSSTMPSSSDAALADLHMPVLYPASVAECLELGLHGLAMSRATGLWSALKVVTAVADGSGTVGLPVLLNDPIRPTTTIDGVEWRAQPSAQLLGPRMVEVEREFHEVRTELALRYGIENGLNRIAVDPPRPRLGVLATGFTFGETVEALRRLGVEGEAAVARAGIRLLNLRMPLPFDAGLIRRFASGLDRIIVIEEKNPTLERLVRDALYTHSHRPDVVGKIDLDGERLLPSHGRLDADVISPALRRQLLPLLGEELAPPPPVPRERIPLAVVRAPAFCSGCPHSWGMKVDEGAVVGMGTGCHGMGLLMDPERVGDSLGVTAMGNEGMQWLGMEPFVETEHIVQNLGDGTYFHSGQLAVQAAIGAGSRMTFKILYNHTVAMTGGQDASHQVTPQTMATILLQQGAKRVIITTEDVERYRNLRLPDDLRPLLAVMDRTRIVEAQQELAAIDGVTILINDQGCAAETRRDRKRGLIDTPKTRVFINHRICEGCGDCGDVSGCLSVQPVQTEFGRKTRIDQASCNIDLSCLHGDCPAFVTVNVDDLAVDPLAGGPVNNLGHGGSILLDEPLPEPPIGTGGAVVRLAGVGGTGVVTVAQILSTAAMLAGRQVAGLDQTGLSQKAGPVVSDVVISPESAVSGSAVSGSAVSGSAVSGSNLAGTGQADVVLAFDQMVAAADGALTAVGPQTRVLASASRPPTGAQVVNPTLEADSMEAYAARFGAASDHAVEVFDTALVAQHLVGSAATANICLLGVALQAGLLPLDRASIGKAIELNGVAVEANLAALEWGRRYASDREAVEAVLASASASGSSGAPSAAPALSPALLSRTNAAIEGAQFGVDDARSLTTRVADLVAYQDEAYAGRYLDLVDLALTAGDNDLVMSVARGFHKLMAYKDEYEIARLMLLEGALPVPKGTKLRWHLHPPLLKALGLENKVRVPSAASPAFVVLAKAKRLRGTRLDPFGRNHLRKLERELVDEYEAFMKTALVHADAAGPQRLAVLAELAEAPLAIRGYEDLKLQRIELYRRRVIALRSEL